MRILYVGSPELFGSGASSIHVAKMVEAFGHLKHEVDLLIPIKKNKINDFYMYYSVNKNFKIINSVGVSAGSLRHFLHGIISLFSIKEKYNLIITRNITFAFLGSFFLKNIIIDIHHPPINFFSKIAIKRFIKSSNVKNIICNSAGTYKHINANNIKKAKILPNGVDLKKFDKAYDLEILRKKLKINKNIKIVSYIGNLYQGRGIEMIIKLSKHFENLFFLLVGGEKSDIENYRNLLSEENKNILFTGHILQSDIVKYYKLSDFLIIPYENNFTIKGSINAATFSSPIKLFEHLASEKPIIASNIDSINSILKDGQDAILVSEGDFEEYVKKITNLVNDEKLQKKLSENAKKKSLKFSWINRAKGFIDQ